MTINFEAGLFCLDPVNDPPALTGGLSDDVLSGTAANEVLTGGGGNDTYVFGRGGGQDRVVNGTADNTGPSGDLDFGVNIGSDQLWFQQDGGDLRISVLGSQDRVTVAGWYDSSAAQLQEIKIADGSQIDSGLSQLVQAMATYSADNPGFDPATSAQQPNDSTVQTAIAAAWHH